MPISQESAATQLAEIATEKVHVWVSREDGWCSITAELPYVPAFEAEYSVRQEDQPDTVFLYMLDVPKELRRRGIATRLLGAMTYAAKTEGFNRLRTSTESTRAMGLFRKLFNETDIHIFDSPTNDHALVEIPMTVEQAVQSMRSARKAGEPDDLIISVDLESFELEEADRPVIHHET